MGHSILSNLPTNPQVIRIIPRLKDTKSLFHPDKFDLEKNTKSVECRSPRVASTEAKTMKRMMCSSPAAISIHGIKKKANWLSKPRRIKIEYMIRTLCHALATYVGYETVIRVLIMFPMTFAVPAVMASHENHVIQP